MGITKYNLTSLDVIITTLFLFCGGNIIFTSYKWYAFVIVAFMLTIMIAKRRQLLEKKIVLWLILFGFLAGIQVLSLSIISRPAYFNFAAKLYAGYLIVSYLGTRFRYSYFKVLVFFSIIGLILWIIHLAYPFNIGIPYGNSSKSLVIWSYFIGEEGYRNQGMFWEPGAYQGYIMLIPILYMGELRELWRSEKKGCVVLILSLLSTTSTTGYLAFAFVLFMYFVKGIQNAWVKIFIIPLFILCALYAFSSLDFMGDKLTQQYEAAKDMDYSDTGVLINRMGTMMIDLQMIQNSPIIGNGFDGDMKYGELSEVMESSGNGLTGFMNTFGIPFFLIYLISLFKAFPYSSYYKFVSIITLLMLLFGENFINFIPFWSLLFVKYDNIKEKNEQYKTQSTMVIPNPRVVL